MFFLRVPSDEAIRAILDGLADAAFTHGDLAGATRELAAAPHGYRLDRYGAELGRGDAVFDRAKAALARLDNYPPSFTRVVRGFDTPAEGALFATVARHLGFASVLPCRIIYTIDAPARFGLGFGTLPGHAERGEERFVVSIEDDVVRYDVLAISRPAGLLPRLGAPITRHYQRRFQRETLETMCRQTRPTGMRR